MKGNDSLAPVGAGDEYALRPPDPDKGNWDGKTRAWRLSRFLDMGFDADQAEELAVARTWTGAVEQLLDRGCSRALAHDIAT